METKHTKGEWKFDNLHCVVLSNEDFNIKDVELWPHQYEDIAELNANAKLIAAAPDLLNALISAMRIVDLWTFGGKVAEEHMDEAISLNSMRESFESAIEKATK